MDLIASRTTDLYFLHGAALGRQQLGSNELPARDREMTRCLGVLKFEQLLEADSLRHLFRDNDTTTLVRALEAAVSFPLKVHVSYLAGGSLPIRTVLLLVCFLGDNLVAQLLEMLFAVFLNRHIEVPCAAACARYQDR